MLDVVCWVPKYDLAWLSAIVPVWVPKLQCLCVFTNLMLSNSQFFTSCMHTLW